MIKDNISNAEFYTGLSKGIKEGLEWIKNTDLDNIADGRYDLNGINYANVQSYNTKDEALFEAHRNYIDIQYVIKGAEMCGISDYCQAKTEIEYDNQKDIEFLSVNHKDYVTLKEKEFLILFPQDAHQPSMNVDGKRNAVKKVVVKVHI